MTCFFGLNEPAAKGKEDGRKNLPSSEDEVVVVVGAEELANWAAACSFLAAVGGPSILMVTGDVTASLDWCWDVTAVSAGVLEVRLEPLLKGPGIPGTCTRCAFVLSSGNALLVEANEEFERLLEVNALEVKDEVLLLLLLFVNCNFPGSENSGEGFLSPLMIPESEGAGMPEMGVNSDMAVTAAAAAAAAAVAAAEAAATVLSPRLLAG